MSGGLGRGLGSLIPKSGSPRLTVPSSASATDISSSGGVLQIPTSQIVANPHQPRQSIDHAALEDLINSIREHGILQPLVVVKVARGYQLIAGERRFRSAQIIGMRTVPAIVRDATTQEQLELAVVENVQRKDLNPMERAAAYQKLIDEFGLTQEQVAKRVGKSRATVANGLRLLELPKEVRDALGSEKITEGHAKVIAGLVTPKDQLRLLHDILEKNLSVRGGEAAAGVTGHPRRRKPADPAYLAVEEELRDVFGTRVRVDKKGKGGTITIEFYSSEEFRTIVQKLRKR